MARTAPPQLTASLLTENEAGPLVRLSGPTLRNLRSQGRGPAFSKLGRSVRYTREDLAAWVARNRVDPEAGW